MENVRELIGELQRVEKTRIECAERLNEVGGLKLECTPNDLNLRVGAVDTSIVSQEFHAFDLIITKTVGVVFEYRDGKLYKHEYIPSPFPAENVHTHGSMDLLELSQYRNIVRLKEEIGLAHKVAGMCDLMLIDGSLAPLPGDRPANKDMRGEYDELLGLYMQLFERHEQKLAGVVKDSRSKRVMEEYGAILDASVMANSTDSTLLDMVLKKGERTKTLTYSKDAKTNPVLKDLLPYSERLNVSYIKAGRNDRPVRIEFFGENSDIVNTLYSLCAINDNYSYPAVLIDVDLRALIDPKAVERIYHEIEIAPFLKDSRLLRRNSRPFR